MKRKRLRDVNETEKEYEEETPTITPTHKSTDPWTKISVPSGFKPYADKELFIRPLKVGEVKRLRPIVMTEDHESILDILKGLIRPIKPADLTTGDFWYILAWLRLNTFRKTPIEVPWTCPKCQTRNVSTYDMSDENLSKLPDEYLEPAMMTLPISEEEIPLRYPRIGDIFVYQKYLKVILNKTDISPEDSYIPELACMIADSTPLETRIKKLEAMDPEDILEIENFVDAFSHGLKTLFTDTCGSKECEYENNHIRFFFRLSHILPINRTKKRVRNAVRFGGSSTSTTDR